MADRHDAVFAKPLSRVTRSVALRSLETSSASLPSLAVIRGRDSSPSPYLSVASFGASAIWVYLLRVLGGVETVHHTRCLSDVTRQSHVPPNVVPPWIEAVNAVTAAPSGRYRHLVHQAI